MRFALDTNEQSRVQMEGELGRSVKALRGMFDVEVRSREEDVADKSALLTALEKRLESLGLNQTQVSADFHDKLRKIGDELQSEMKERAAADDEITAIAMSARNIIEKEIKD